MAVQPPVRGTRVGGVTVGPGEARAVSIALAPRRRADGAPLPRAIPAWVVVGNRPGPRISIVAAVRGVESSAARAAVALGASLDPAALHGSVVVVPVLRPGGRLVPGRPGASWRFPGDAGGRRSARDAFAIFSDVAVGSQALVVLGGPRRGRRGALVARGHADDARVKRLAMASGAVAMFPPPESLGGLLEAAAAAGIPALELAAESGAGDRGAASSLATAARTILEALGAFGREAGEGGARRPNGSDSPWPPPVAVTASVDVEAPGNGFLDAPVSPGTVVRAKAVLGHLAPGLPGAPLKLDSPVDGIVVEAALPGPVQAGAKLFALVPIERSVARRLLRSAAPGAPAVAGPGADGSDKLHVGWVEEISLPSLGLDRLKAKIDTGARTSALHVSRMRTVDTTGGPHRRPILEITVPRGGRRRPVVVRAAVRGFTSVRDTSGRIERRPVIETALKLGAIKRRIAVTLTNRGDMLFPMLIGRTALGPGILVDTSRRYLLRR